MAEQSHQHTPDATQQDQAGQAAPQEAAPQAAQMDPNAPDAQAPEGDAVNIETIIEAARARIGALEEELGEAKEQALRSLAEAENVRKRAEREKDDMRKFAVSSFAKDLLSVSDNLRRALDAVPADKAESDDSLKSFVEGVGMTERELLSVFEKNGISKVGVEGENFDHNYHQAIQEMEDPSKPTGTILQVLQAGYVQHGRLLRPAMVIVSRGGPRAGDGVDTVA